MDDMKEIIDDQLLVTKKAEDMYPNKPLSLLGHSLGSVFARCYIQEHDANIEKLILSGTVNYVPGVSFGIMLGKLIARSEEHTSELQSRGHLVCRLLLEK